MLFLGEGCLGPKRGNVKKKKKTESLEFTLKCSSLEISCQINFNVVVYFRTEAQRGQRPIFAFYFSIFCFSFYQFWFLFFTFQFFSFSKKSYFPNTLTSKRAKNSPDENIFFNVYVDTFMSRTVITLKFKMCLFLDEASY